MAFLPSSGVEAWASAPWAAMASLFALIHQGEGHTGFVLHYPAHLGALLGVQPGHYGAALAGGHIGPDAALNAHQMGAVRFSGGELGGEHGGIAGLFNIGHGEIGVRA